MKKDDKAKKPFKDELHDDIDLFEDFEEPTEVKKPDQPKQRDDSITDELPEGENPPEDILDEDVLQEPPSDKSTSSKPESKPKPKPEPEPEPEKKSNLPDEILEMSSDIPVQLVAVVGKTTVSVKELMNYQMGQVIDLGRPPGETVDLVASGKLFARGELVDIDGKLGVRIIKLTR